MAYIKIFPIKVADNKALDYIMNPHKTEKKLLISSSPVPLKPLILNLPLPEKKVKRM